MVVRCSGHIPCGCKPTSLWQGMGMEWKAKVEKVVAAAKRMDESLTAYWNTCDESSFCCDPDCDGDCHAAAWEEFEAARDALRKLIG